MATPYLCLNNRTGTPTVKRVVAGSPADQGIALPSATTETDGWSLLPGNQRTLRFRGCNTWIVVQKSRIYRTTDAGASYTTVYGPDTDLGEAGKTGPYLFYINGTATLVVLAVDGLGQVRMYTSTDGVSWTKSSVFTGFGGNPNFPIVSCVQWRGALYALRYDTSVGLETLVLNPGASTFSRISTVVNGAQYGGDLCVVDDKLFQLALDVGGTPSYKLYEMVGGVWTLRSTIVTITSPSNTSAPALFYDHGTGRLVALMVTGTPSYRAFSIDPTTFATTDLGGTITGAFGAAANSGIFRVLYDGSVSVGGTPVPFIYYKSDGNAGAMGEFQWNGTGVAPSLVGSGVDAAFCVPFGDQATAGGSVFWTSGQRHIERLTATPVAGGVRYGFQIFSPNVGPDLVSVAWIIGLAAAEFPATPFGSLSNPSAGTISGGNQIDGLDAADNGATTFLVTWDAYDDGFPNNAYGKTCPTIFS